MSNDNHLLLTLSRILWKSSTLNDFSLHTSHSRYHLRSLTGFPTKLKNFKEYNSLSGSKSPSSMTLLLVSTIVVMLGAERCKDGEMVAIRLFARRSVRNRFNSGKLARAVTELSVRSMESC